MTYELKKSQLKLVTTHYAEMENKKDNILFLLLSVA